VFERRHCRRKTCLAEQHALQVQDNNASKSKRFKGERDERRASPGKPTRTRQRERLSIEERLTPPAPRIYMTVGTRPDAVPHQAGAIRMQALLFVWKHIRVPLKDSSILGVGEQVLYCGVGGARRLTPSSILVSGRDSSPLFRLSSATRRSEPAFMDFERLMACCPMKVAPPTAGDSRPPTPKQLAWH
jgi:hypothetical protein